MKVDQPVEYTVMNITSTSSDLSERIIGPEATSFLCPPHTHTKEDENVKKKKKKTERKKKENESGGVGGVAPSGRSVGRPADYQTPD